MKANGVEGAAACRGLETRLIECYGEVVCPAQAEAFQVRTLHILVTQSFEKLSFARRSYFLFLDEA